MASSFNLILLFLGACNAGREPPGGSMASGLKMNHVLPSEVKENIWSEALCFWIWVMWFRNHTWMVGWWLKMFRKLHPELKTRNREIKNESLFWPPAPGGLISEGEAQITADGTKSFYQERPLVSCVPRTPVSFHSGLLLLHTAQPGCSCC